MSLIKISFPRLLLLLNIAALAMYFIVQYQLGFPATIHENMFSTGDSQEYRDYGLWLSGKSDYCNPVRTYFYPLLILGARTVMGETGIWLMQFLFWIGACNLTFLSVKRITRNRAASAVVFIICASNLSLVTLTTHALTEVTVFFFFALILFFIARALTAVQPLWPYMGALFTLSALAAVKPQYMVLLYLAIAAVLFILRKQLLRPKVILLLVLCTMPAIVQKVINKTQHGTFSSTAIGSSNLRLYYFRKVQHVVKHGSIESFDEQTNEQHLEEQEEVKGISDKGIYSFLLKHPWTSFIVFIDNLKNNMATGHPYIDAEKHRSLYKWTHNTNNKFYYLNLYGFLVWAVFAVARLRSKRAADKFVIASGMLAFFALFTTGLVFWAGDRLIAPAVAAWTCCYAVMTVQIAEVYGPRIKAKLKRR